MTRPAPWTDEENSAVVALYFIMLDHAIAGEKYNKAAMIRREQEQLDLDHPDGQRVPWLADRSRGSIEAKLMNVTGVLIDLGRDDVSMAEHGYRPMSNYQSDLKTMVVGLLAVRDEAVAGGFEAQA